MRVLQTSGVLQPFLTSSLSELGLEGQLTFSREKPDGTVVQLKAWWKQPDRHRCNEARVAEIHAAKWTCGKHWGSSKQLSSGCMWNGRRCIFSTALCCWASAGLSFTFSWRFPQVHRLKFWATYSLPQYTSVAAFPVLRQKVSWISWCFL